MESQLARLGNRVRRSTLAPIALAAVLVLSPVTGPVASTSPLEALFVAAGQEYRVPAQLLMAVSYVETRWDDHGSSPSLAYGFGLMHLQDNPYNDSLQAASVALGVGVGAIVSSAGENIRGGAALLRGEYLTTWQGDPMMVQAASIDRWYIPVAKYLRSDDMQTQRDFADRVYALLAHGVHRATSGGVVQLAPVPSLSPARGPYEAFQSDAMIAARARGRADVRRILKVAAPLLGYPEGGADEWVGTANYTAGRTGQLSGVVIHTCQDTWSGCISELQRVGSLKSSHYVVRSSDGRRFQLVQRVDTAWQCGECTQAPFYGNWNPRTIGIEHEGWSSDPSWYNSTVYSRSAWLTAYACVNFNFGGCSQYNNVYGHDYAQPGNSDPGGGWNWSWYNQCVGERIEFLRTGSWPPGMACY